MIILFLFATYPGKGGLEGDQREILGISNRTDNWGFIVPFLIGQWPNVLGHWRFSLVLFQLILFWIGLALLLEETWREQPNRRFLIVLLASFSSVFVSQLWRDATLLALATFGFGVLSASRRTSGFSKLIMMLGAVLVLHFAAMFKVLYGCILGLIFLWSMIQNRYITKRSVSLALLVVVSLASTPFLLDKYLSNKVGLIKVFPEQQPIIFDLASSYCWGQSPELISNAADGLSMVKKASYPMESICSSLKPTTWDNLHASAENWQYSSPISRITGAQDAKVSALRKTWTHMIISNPVDWLQVRLMYLGWTLTLSNSFVPQNSTNTWGGYIGSLNKSIWTFFFLFASYVDKFRLSSLLFAFLITFILLVYKCHKSNLAGISFFYGFKDIFIAQIILISTTLVTLVGFVASNGRYVLPYTLLVYFLLIRSKGLRSPIQV